MRDRVGMDRRKQREGIYMLLGATKRRQRSLMDAIVILRERTTMFALGRELLAVYTFTNRRRCDEPLLHTLRRSWHKNVTVASLAEH